MEFSKELPCFLLQAKAINCQLRKGEVQERTRKTSEAQGSVNLFLEARKGELVHVSRRALM